MAMMSHERGIDSERLGPYEHYVAGSFVAPADGRAYRSVNPTTGADLYEAALGSAADVTCAVSAARSALAADEWRHMTATNRGHLLRRLGDAIVAHATELARIETLDNGKVISETTAQMDTIAEHLYYAAGLADKVQGSVIPAFSPGSLTYTLREPIGVIGAIVPWNSPLLLAVYKIAPVLATGNTLVLKPSEHSAASVLECAKLFAHVGLPPGVINIVTGDGSTGAALAEHPNVDKMSFTGGTETGRRVARAAAGHLADVLLELGGKSAHVVFPDADPEPAAAAIAGGIFSAAGQSCIAGSRALVHESLYDDIIARVVQRARAIRLGDPLDPETEMGPLCFEAHRERVEGAVSAAVDAGADLLAGGQRPATDGWFFEPTVFGEVHNDMDISQYEIFGPVLAVQRWSDERDAVRRVNDSVYGLAAGIWTRDVARAHRIAIELDVGTVWVNRYRANTPLTPTGGFKASGVGKENGMVGINEYLRLKVVGINTADAPPIGHDQ